MHIFIGGSHNGKHEYVKKWLQEKEFYDVEWFIGQLPKNPTSKTIVVSGLENVIKKDLEKDEITLATEITEHLKTIDENHQLIVIATEMGRGIVPIDPKDRQLRDTSGRLYQQLFEVSEHITKIWYGIAEKLK